MKITNTNSIKAYRYHQFESSCYRTPEYVEFEKKYINFFRRMCKNNGWELAEVRKMHFECSIVIKGGMVAMYMFLEATSAFLCSGTRGMMRFAIATALVLKITSVKTTVGRTSTSLKKSSRIC